MSQFNTKYLLKYVHFVMVVIEIINIFLIKHCCKNLIVVHFFRIVDQQNF